MMFIYVFEKGRYFKGALCNLYNFNLISEVFLFVCFVFWFCLCFLLFFKRFLYHWNIGIHGCTLCVHSMYSNSMLNLTCNFNSVIKICDFFLSVAILGNFHSNKHKLALLRNVKHLFWLPFSNRFFFPNFISNNVRVCMFSYFEPNFFEKILLEKSFFLNFAHVTIFAKRNFFFWQPFETQHFFF